MHWRHQEHVWPRDPKLAAVADLERKPREAPVDMVIVGASLVCSICGSMHWRHQEHVWPRDPRLAAVADPERKPREAPVDMVLVGAGSSCETQPRQSGPAAGWRSAARDVKRAKPVGDAGDAGGSPAPKFDKRAYQREYMRQRRAKQRSAE
jgi:hypothetical protein